MTQFSWPWSCTDTGDGGTATFTLDVVEMMHRISNNLVPSSNGVVYWTDTTVLPFTGFSNACDGLLAPSEPGGGTVRIASGIGRVQGWYYANDSNVDFDIDSSPGAASATDIIVLRRDRSAQTVRLARISGGAGSKATLTQTTATWEIPIVDVVLTAGGLLSSTTDARTLAYAPIGTRALIERKVLAAGTTTVSFTSIPPLFRSLRLELMARSTDNGGPNPAYAIQMRFNGDAAANYQYALMTANTAATSTAGSGAQSRIQLGSITSATGTANKFDGYTVDIPEYSNTNFHKVANSQGSLFSTGAAALTLYESRGYWLNTAAINQIDLICALTAEDFLTSSVFSLYGIV